MKWTEGDGQVWRLYDAGVLAGFVTWTEPDPSYRGTWLTGKGGRTGPMTTLNGAMTRVADEVLAGER